MPVIKNSSIEEFKNCEDVRNIFKMNDGENFRKKVKLNFND